MSKSKLKMSDKLKEQAEANRILEIKTGSHLYGTNVETSDEDYAGIFMPSEEYVFGLKNVAEVDLGVVDKGADGKNTAEAIDRKLYEFRKFINLAMANNPNIIEMLFVEEKNIIFCNDVGRKLLEHNHLFPSKQAAQKFIGYAKSQRHKMIIRRDHFNELRAGHSLLEKLDDKIVMAEVVKESMNKVRITDNVADSYTTLFKKRGSHILCGDINFEPGIYVKKARKMLKERIDKVTNRKELVLKYGFDTKFGAHLIRLLTEGITLLETGRITFPLPNKDELLSIRNGDLTIEEIIEYSESLENRINLAIEKTSLPATPPYAKIEAFVIEQMRSSLL